jgi:hypothetical protein
MVRQLAWLDSASQTYSKRGSMVEYPTFESWFEELENFNFRSDRFFEHLELATNAHERREICTLWLRTAFEMGRNNTV